MTMNIPSPFRPGIATLAGLPAAQRTKLVEVLRAFPPTTDLAKLTDEVKKAMSWPLPTAGQVVSILLNGYIQLDQENESPAQVAKEIVANAPPDLKLDEPTSKGLLTFIEELLKIDRGFGVSAKAMAVRNDIARSFSEARVLTDLRPVFKPGTVEVLGFSIIHNLRISFIEGENVANVFVACSEGELKQLQRHLERAAKKAEAVRKSMPSATFIGE